MEKLVIAMISDVFFGKRAKEHLVSHLTEAKNAGAQLAVLPEIACNPWSPSTKNLRVEDAEELGGTRCSMQSESAKEVGIGLIGAAILKQNGERYNTCLFWDEDGKLLGTYQKHHIRKFVS